MFLRKPLPSTIREQSFADLAQSSPASAEKRMPWTNSCGLYRFGYIIHCLKKEATRLDSTGRFTNSLKYIVFPKRIENVHGHNSMQRQKPILFSYAVAWCGYGLNVGLITDITDRPNLWWCHLHNFRLPHCRCMVPTTDESAATTGLPSWDPGWR